MKELTQSEIVDALLKRCRDDGRVDSATARVVRALLRQYREENADQIRRGRPLNLDDRHRLAEFDAMQKVYGLAGSYGYPQNESQRFTGKELGISRRNVARWRNDPTIKQLVDTWESEEWEWINSKEFEPD